MNKTEIDNIIKKITSDLKYYQVKKEEVTAVQLCAEELLYLYSDKKFILKKAKTKRSATALSLELYFQGDCMSPEEAQKIGNNYILKNILRKKQYKLIHRYSGNCNHISLYFAKYYTAFSNLKFTYNHTKGDRKILFFGVASHVLSIISNLFIPYLTGLIITSYTENKIYQVLTVAISILIARSLYTVFFGLANICYNKISFSTENKLLLAMTDKLFHTQDKYIEKKGHGFFLERITTDNTLISNSLPNICDIITEAIYYIGVLFATLTISINVFVIELITFFILLFLEIKRGKKLDLDRRGALQSSEDVSGKIADFINGVIEIKLLNGQKTFFDKMKRSSQKKAENKSKTNSNTRILMALSSIFTALMHCLTMLCIGYEITTNKISVAEGIVVFNYFTIIGVPVITLIQRYIDFRKIFHMSCERIRNFLDDELFPVEKKGNKHIENLYGDIVINNLSFAYDVNLLDSKNKEILHNLSLTIKTGETTAIIGPSGSGKTTLMKLITGQCEPDSGNIKFGDINLKELDNDSIRNVCSIISQSPYIFNMTIRDNLLIAKPDATQEELDNACKMACLHDEILGTQNGYDTLLGERGVGLSGGQCQRLAIARALLRKSNYIFLDEATSAVDNIAQTKIIKAINNLEGSHTVVMIAHRLSTIKTADKIIVLDSGNIVGEGTHEELMNSCEEYKKLYNLEE